jgi:hypothetical protein
VDIYIVLVERRADSARMTLWIDAPNSRAAKINALRIAGKSDFKVVTVELLADMVKVKVALPKKKARKKARSKSGVKSPKRRAGKSVGKKRR